MTDMAPAPVSRWPLARGEHPTLGDLHLELHVGRPATTGRKATTATPPYARMLFRPLPVFTTCNPDRIRKIAHQLLRLAADLEVEHATHAEHTGQLPLDEKGR